MTDFNPPSVPPSSEKKDTVTLNKKNLAIAFFAAACVILFIIIAIPSSNSTNNSSITTDPVTTEAPVQTSPVNKYDDYVNYVLNNSGKANTWSRADLIEFGDLVCQSLDNGNSISSVVTLLEGYASSNSDAELFASFMIGSINNLCPEYKSDLTYYLNN